MQARALPRYEVRSFAPADEGRLAEARAFAHDNLYERALLHADLEDPELLVRARFLRVGCGGRIVGLGAVLEGVFPYRSVPLAATLPGAAAVMLAEVARPFTAIAPQALWPELERADARSMAADLQMVRLRRDPLPAPDRRVAPLRDRAELERLLGSPVPEFLFSRGPFLCVRAPDGSLLASGGVRSLTPRLAYLGYVETRPDQRRQGLASAIVVELVRALESDLRRVGLQVREDNKGAIALYGRLGFRGTRRFGFLERAL